MTETTMPNFDAWAYAVGESLGNPQLIYQEKISEALKQAFEQGYALGKREGYIDGSDFGWICALESDEGWIKHHTNEE